MQMVSQHHSFLCLFPRQIEQSSWLPEEEENIVHLSHQHAKNETTSGVEVIEFPQ